MRNQNKQSRSETTKSQKQTKENRKYVKSLIQLGPKIYRDQKLQIKNTEIKTKTRHIYRD